MSLDVRTYEPGEKGKEFRRNLFWPSLILLVGVLAFLCIKVGPRWFGYDRKIQNALVMVRIYDAPDTRTQVIAGVKDKKVSATVPDLTVRHPDGSADVPLNKVVDLQDGKMFANKRAVIQNAEIQRVLGDDVIAVGDNPDNQIFVHMAADVRPANSSQLDPKARVNIAGNLMPMPPIDRAKELLRIKDLGLENRPLPPIYLEATSVRLVEAKPMYGDD